MCESSIRFLSPLCLIGDRQPGTLMLLQTSGFQQHPVFTSSHSESSRDLRQNLRNFVHSTTSFLLLISTMSILTSNDENLISGPWFSSALNFTLKNLPQTEQGLGTPFLSCSTRWSAGRSRRTAKEVSCRQLFDCWRFYLGLSTSPKLTLPPWPGLAKVQRKRLILYQFIRLKGQRVGLLARSA